MRWLGSTLVTAAVAVVALTADVVAGGLWPGLLVAAATAAWAAADAARSGSGRPAVVLAAVLLAWPVYFPLYLIGRSRRVAGEGRQTLPAEWVDYVEFAWVVVAVTGMGLSSATVWATADGRMPVWVMWLLLPSVVVGGAGCAFSLARHPPVAPDAEPGAAPDPAA